MTKRKKKEPSMRYDPAVAIDDLRPDPDNPRQISDGEMNKLRRSLREFGFVDPVIARAEDNRIIGGHQRIEAAKLEGWKKPIPVVFLSGLSDERASLLNIALNKISGEFDLPKLEALLGDLDLSFPNLDLTLAGFDEDELNLLLHPAGEIVEDEVPEPPKKPVTKPGDLWLLGEHRLLCGDSTKAEHVKRAMVGEKADCVFTSPPYAVGIDYGSYDDTIDNLRAMLPRLSAQWLEVVRPGGYAVINFGDIVSASDIVGTEGPCEYPMALEYWPIFRVAGWVLWSRRIWCKPGAKVGSMQCISSNRAATNWEHVWTWKAPGKPLHNKQTTGDYPSQRGWFDTSAAHGLDVGLDVHGAGMPVITAVYAISIHSFLGHIVHEPFSGSGTTLIAAEQLGRKCYGIEICEEYVDVTCQRWMNLTGKEPIRERDGKTWSQLKKRRS